MFLALSTASFSLVIINPPTFQAQLYGVLPSYHAILRSPLVGDSNNRARANRRYTSQFVRNTFSVTFHQSIFPSGSSCTRSISPEVGGELSSICRGCCKLGLGSNFGLQRFGRWLPQRASRAASKELLRVSCGEARWLAPRQRTDWLDCGSNMEQYECGMRGIEVDVKDFL